MAWWFQPLSTDAAWNPAASPDEPDHWSRVLGADYAGTDCKNCNRSRVLHYEEVNRFICEKCNWDQVAGDYAVDHERIG
jgi:ribosomal protein L37AE/L43A